jgi:ribonucleoside-triphosphate reductase
MEVTHLINWGPTGEDVYRRTYSRTKHDGTKEEWPDTVARVVHGNINLVDSKHIESTEAVKLAGGIATFDILPAGRHLWASGVKGRQFLFNCWNSGWGDNVSDHFRFSFLRLMEGGGVGANYSSKKTERYGPPRRAIDVHVVCDEDHADYDEMRAQGLLSATYSPDYQGAYTEVEDSREGWADALSELLEAAWAVDSPTVLVFDVSRVRPKGARLKTFGGYASGPGPLARMLLDIARVINDLISTAAWVEGYENYPIDPISAMEIDHAIAQCVVAGGNRRSARMSILPWNDPWINEFIKVKEDASKHWTTNISVAIDDDFIKELDYPYSRSGPILSAIADGMLRNGEPGIWNYSLSQDKEIDEVTSTNPCGEVTLNDWEACNLGHLNLERFVDDKGFFLWEDAKNAARVLTRFLIRATYGDITDPKSREIMDRNRRIGVGLLGVQAAFVKMGIPYSQAPNSGMCAHILETLRDIVREEAHDYAFQLRIPEPVKVTCVAPTGTVAKLAGTSEGIHPIYSRYFIRRIRFATNDPDQMAQLSEYKDKGYKVEPCIYAENTMVVEIPTMERLIVDAVAMGHKPSIVESADELSLDTLMAFQEMVQDHWADNAISFTANIPEGKVSQSELIHALKSWLPYLKGTTVMPDGNSRPQAPYERITEEEYSAFIGKTGYVHMEDSIDEECSNGVCPIR